MNLEYEAFMQEIESLIDMKIKDFMKNEGVYICYPAAVQQVDSHNDKCVINSAKMGTQKEILNKSSEDLKMNDSVLVMQKYGTAAENCFIIAKNQSKRS